MTTADPSGSKQQYLYECDPSATEKAETADLVVLDWSGGVNPIYSDQLLGGIDLAQFDIAEGGTLADHSDQFKEMVRREVAAIFCEWPEVAVIVENGEDDGAGQFADTIVHITHEVRPDGKMDIGQGEYDPCNGQNDNAAIVFGKRILQLGGAYSLEEWVRVFANVTAHEVGHTLGYGHVLREEREDVGRSIYVELMLDRHTMTEMRKAQRFVATQSNCPDESGDYEPVQGAMLTCGHED